MIKKLILAPIIITDRVLKIRKIIKKALKILDNLSIDEIEAILEMFENVDK